MQTDREDCRLSAHGRHHRAAASLEKVRATKKAMKARAHSGA